MGRAVLAGIAATLIGCGRLGFGEHVVADAQDAPDMFDVEVGDAPTYRASAVRFETAGNDFLWTGSLLDTSNSPRGTYSVWIRFTGGDDQLQALNIAQVAAAGGVLRTAGNRFQFLLFNCLGLILLDMQSEGTYTEASGWVHVLASWDLSAGRAQLYVNGVADRMGNPGMINGGVCYDSLRWGIGGLYAGQLDADLADMYAALGTSIDLDVEANRRLFRDAAGRPADLGPDCSGPTGSPASGCFVGDASTWNVNHGNAAGFTLEGDGLVAAPTSPSD